MPDWTRSMMQTFEFYVMDPTSYSRIKKLDTITKCTIRRDLKADTLGSASFESTEDLEECYIGIFLITIQDDVKESIPLGVFLNQSPGWDFDGYNRSISSDAYTPLIELQEKMPPLGYTVRTSQNILNSAYLIARDNMRTPVVKTSGEINLTSNFVANQNDTWLKFITELLANEKYELAFDEYNRLLFAPHQDVVSMRPIWTYNDDNSSILYPDISLSRDLYDVPNVVEVVYSKNDLYFFSRVKNDNEDSETSIPRRGREILYREDASSTANIVSQEQLDGYARNILREKSSLEYQITYKHGYCPVQIGDCVRLDYYASGLFGVKAKVTSQSIECVPGCPVSETAVYSIAYY